MAPADVTHRSVKKGLIDHPAVWRLHRLIEWRERLICYRCGGRQFDMMVSGTERAPAAAR